MESGIRRSIEMEIAGFFRESPGALAQMVRASGRQPEGRRFKSGMFRRVRIANGRAPGRQPGEARSARAAGTERPSSNGQGTRLRISEWRFDSSWARFKLG